MRFFNILLILLCFAFQGVSFSEEESLLPENAKILEAREKALPAVKNTPSTSSTHDNFKDPIFPPEEFIPVPDEKERSQFLSEFISTMATLGLIISLILMAGWFLKRMVNNRMVQANDFSEIKVVERRMISPKTAIYAIEVKGKGVILAETVNGVVRLADYAAEEVADDEKDPAAFKKLLDNSQRK